MRCVRCGTRASRPKWVVYADEGFAHKAPVNPNVDPFPVCRKCFASTEHVTITEWVHPHGDTTREPELESRQVRRYREVDTPPEDSQTVIIHG